MAKGPLGVSHSQAWDDAFVAHTDLPVDIVGSLREEAINEILSKHFQFDNARYTFQFQKTFNANGKERTFKITVKADDPIVVDLPPFSTTSKDPLMAKRFEAGGWFSLEAPPRSSKLTVPPLKDGLRGKKASPVSPNIRVFCKSFSFVIEWPKLNGTGNWTWTPTPITVVAEAVIELHLTQDGPILHIQLLKVKFDPVHALQKQTLKMLSKLPIAERKALSECDEKFNDLLVIAMNIAATNYAPKMVKDINIPVPVVANLAVKPSLLEMADKMVTVGLTVDRAALAQKNSARLQTAVETFQGLLSQDIEAAGGLEFILTDGGWAGSGVEGEKNVKLRSDSEVRERLPLAMTYLRTLERSVRTGTKRTQHRTRIANVSDGLGVGASQDALTRFARASMPIPVNKCTDWQDVLDVVRGRICWWVHIFDPVVNIAGTTLSGQVSIDIGGAIEACVRKFWDCSWSWDCNSLSLAVEGRPGVALNLQSGNGISFYAHLIPGNLRLVSNLPFPFNKVVEFFSSLVVDAIVAVINAIAANIKFDILLPEFQLPKQITKIQFSGIVPFAYSRKGGQFTPAERTFIGFSVGVTAKK